MLSYTMMISINKFDVFCFLIVVFKQTDIIANAFLMFLAGFETVSSTMSYCLYELALNKTIQDRVREEATHTKTKYNGDISQDYLKDLRYLQMVISGLPFL